MAAIGPDLSKGYESFKKTHPRIDYLGKCKLVYPSEKTKQIQLSEQSLGKADSIASNKAAVLPIRVRNSINEQVAAKDEKVDVQEQPRDGNRDKWFIKIHVNGGTVILIQLMPLIVAAMFGFCFRLLLPKFSTRLVRRLTGCDI